jgi:hypothetical protein
MLRRVQTTAHVQLSGHPDCGASLRSAVSSAFRFGAPRSSGSASVFVDAVGLL